MVSHYLGNDNTTDVLPGSSGSSDVSKIKSNVGINWGNIFSALPSVIGHVVQIGTTIASVLGFLDGDSATVATNTLKTAAFDSKTGFYQLMIHDIGSDKQGLAIGCYDAAGAAVTPHVAKYVIPFLEWPKKVQ